MQGLIRSIKRRFGISAPRMTVRTQLAWYWRWLLMILFGGLTAGCNRKKSNKSCRAKRCPSPGIPVHLQLHSLAES
jgi:hypothetical protein